MYSIAESSVGEVMYSMSTPTQKSQNFTSPNTETVPYFNLSELAIKIEILPLSDNI